MAKSKQAARGSVVYDESIVQGIVSIAVNGVEGVVAQPSKKQKNAKDNLIKTVIEKDGIYVSVAVAINYGYNAPDIAYNIQYGVKQNVESMTKYKISKVDVFITDVIFDETVAAAVAAES